MNIGVKFNLSSLEIIKPGTYHFLSSLKFSTLSFKREGAKGASFLEVKLFTNGHISKWVRNSKYLLDYFGKLERLIFSIKICLLFWPCCAQQPGGHVAVLFSSINKQANNYWPCQHHLKLLSTME